MLEADGLPYPQVSIAASRATDGSINVTLAHTDPDEPVEIAINGLPPEAKVHARILSGDALDACNTPETPDRVAARDWDGFRFAGGSLNATLPPACVIALRFYQIA